MATGASEWLVLKDGCLRCDEHGVSSLSYHPSLNAILAVTNRGSIKVIDGTSGAILQSSAVHVKPGGRVRCQYFPTVDKVIFVDDYAVGCRKDLNGILLLDTALQTPVSKPDDVIQLELPVTEAQQLLSACLKKIDISSAEGYDLFIMQLKDGFKNTSHETAGNHKVAKWATVTFHLPHHVLKSLMGAIVNELKKINKNIAALPVASSVMDRLSYLLPSARAELGVGPGRSVDRSLMYSEANRRETFTSWPHVGYRWAQPDPMAQAGFYHQPASSGDDRAMCFTCSVCLVCWEPTDEPWSEHERHSPNCPFVKGEHTQNVPLSVTLATCPAQFPCVDGTDRISCFGVGNCPHFLATATKRGKLCVWDVSKLMKVHLKFEVNAYDPAIVQLLVLSGDPNSAVEVRRPTLAWLEDSSSCSDIPKLEGDSDDLLEYSDSEERSRSDSVTGQTSQKETLEMSLDITALSILQQPEKLQWEIVANVLEDTVKDLEELGANPSLASSKSEKTKEKHLEQHNIPFPCLLTGGLLTYRSPSSSPTSSNSRRSLDALSRTPGESSSDQGSTDNESGTNSELNSPLVKRTLPVLLLYSIKESDEKAGKLFSQMNNIMSKSLHDDGFTVPQIIEMELDNQEQLLLQDPPVTYIQQFAEATANLTSPDSDKWTSMIPKPGTLVQCLRLPKFAEEENLCVDSIIPCVDGVHLLVGLQKCPAEPLSAINQVEALNNLNKLNSALCSRRKGDVEPSLSVVNGTSINVIPCESSAEVLDPLIIQPDKRTVSGGYLVIYKMNYSTRIVTLEQDPVKFLHIKDPQDAITSLILLQPDILDSREDDCEESSEETPLTPKHVNGKEKKCDIQSLGHLVVTTQSGYVKILDLSTFEMMAKVDPPKKEGTEDVDPFASVVYCSGTDRLCACTKGGELHFLQIGEACDDLDETDILVDGSLSKGVEQLVKGVKPLSNPSSPGITGVDLLVDQPFSLEMLTCLVELTRFETFIPRFSATVPPCWVEVQQEQQQRRHPQHLHQHHHGDAAQHTRTWKLQNDSTSWDEHVFELVLPKACMVGHVDFKFLLNSNITNIPQIQVTLLKNKTPGLAKVNETPIDRPVLFPLSPAFNVDIQKNGKHELVDLSEDLQNMEVEDSQSPRLCPFLEDHKEDILCGPVWLASGLDLSGHAGMLTLTSPKLVKGMAGGKYRSFLIHVKAVNDRGTEDSSNGATRPVVRVPALKPQSVKGHSLATLLANVVPGKDKSSAKIGTNNSIRKANNLRGCDLLQEVSVTIRRFKKTCIPKERVQRCAMLQFSDFHEKLLNTLCKKIEDGLATEHAQSLVLDILCWLAAVHSNGPGSLREGKESLLSKTRNCLTEIVHACFFEAGRSIAHKCARFLALCISNGKCEPSQQGFGCVLLKALLENITYLPSAATGGSVYWYFVLLNYVKDEDLAGCSTACASLLTAASRQLQDRLTPMEALLQTRYGLYSSPFDPVLFDLEVSGSSSKNIYNSSASIQSDEIDLSDVLLGSGKVNSCAAAEGSFTSLTGLLEVEPLHFTCVSTSDGTRIERDDASTFTVSTFGVTPAVGGLSAGTVGEASTALSSAAQVALQSLSHAMASAEQQLQNQLGSGLALALSHASHFLQPPPHQSIIIERMHSGARRFVTLDFGRPVLLTDILIPTCGDLASLSIDIWSLGEEVDGRRLVVATDISTHSLILHDLIPPPVCRFMKITVIGRYGSTNARAKIPLGFYYGHTYILPWESELKLMHDPLKGENESANQPDVDQHLSMMVALQEDIQCRYNLACHRLETLLQSIDLPPLNSANNAQYFLRKPDKAVEEDSRVFSSYQDCIQLQLQLNLAHHAVQRLKVALGMSRKTLQEKNDSKELIHTSSTEQLRTVIRYLLDTLLSLLHSSNGHSVPGVLQNTFHAQACEELFKHLCISGTPKIRLHTGLLLVQLCGAERWWGQFLSNVLQELYNSEQLLIFPQDRVFMLLSCIGQRSLSNSSVLESLLNLLDSLLSPLQPHLPIYRRIEGVLDIPMISWVVMLVSRLLDYVATVEDEAAASKKPLNGKERERYVSGNQWSFINNSLHTHSMRSSTKGNSSLVRLYSRKIKKQLAHHKQQLNLLKAKQKALVEQIEKEKIQSNKGSSYKLLVEQAKLKQATSKHFKDLIRLRRTTEWPRSAQDTEVSATKESPEIEPLPFTLTHERCISVVQKLALFLLSMDFTCHADLLLFVCKVLARIANATRPTIHLCEIVNEQQLERLLLLLVGTDFNRGDISWGGAWAQYSLTCMLQDILAGELLAPLGSDALDEVALGEEAGASAGDSDDSLQQLPLIEAVDEPLLPDISGAPSLSSLDKDKEIDLELLQDLMEIDIDPLDIDLEKDPLAAKVFKVWHPISSTWYDYWGADYGTYNYNPYIGGVGIPVAKPPATVEKNGTQTVTVSVSQALDARLEVGLEQQAELMLKMMSTLEADSILQALTNSSPVLSQPSSGTDDSLLQGMHVSNQANMLLVQSSSLPMLSACFNKLFSMLQVHHVQLESLLQLWLTLSLNSNSSEGKENVSDLFLYNANRVPVISLNQASITSFLSVLSWHPNTLLRTWCLVLHSLTLMTNMQLNSGSSSTIGPPENTAQLLVSDPNLLHVLVKFLSGTNPHGTNQHSPQVGPTATQAVQEFLTRLQVHLSSTSPQMFSEFLLKLIHILSTERGAFQTGQGPLDVQVKLLEFTLEQNFEVVSVSTISAVIESVSFLVHHYITCSDKVVSRSGSDSSVGARACFGGLFANIIRPGDAKAVCGEITRDQLMFDLLKLVNILVQLPLSSNKEFSARAPVVSSTTESVSDEEKVYGGKDCNSASSTTQNCTAYVADLVLANQQIMSQILSALGQCNSSAMAMIIGASGLHLTKHENFHGGLDAISVGDGLFTILTTLSKKASTVQMMLQPILTYMACGYMGRQGSLSTCQLSEPLLWFILRVLDTSEALKAFHDMGGVQLICNNMVTSTRAIVNTARSMVSTIMKFLDSGPSKTTDSSLKARVLASEPDNAEGIHNFAPLGTITSSSPTAQPAEVLLQATPPHRRARSAAWSYIFLPEEAWCDLTIHLPAAVLLKEIHIQPHLASLATCPSSVSVEISADGVNMLPLSTPIITSGLTYIKIQLVKAEVASAVCLRLHRPRDASTLGLSQIKLLGLTAFGNTSSATVNNPFLPSEDQVSKTSIGWLRLLHHCLTHISELEAMMASAAAPTANLLQTCAALLMSPYCGMHSPNIEAVLVKVGLQSTRIGLRLIDILLRNCAASGSDPADLNSPLLFGRLNGLSSDSTIDILYQLGTTQDPGTKDRIQTLLKWVSDSAQVASLKRSGWSNYISPNSSSREFGLLMPSPSHLHCVAAILWNSYELPVDYDLPGLLNRDLFESLYKWSMSLPCNMVLKKSVDGLLCSMCHIHPTYFSLVMGWMGITPPPIQSQHRLSITDDSKKQDLNASLTDDSKNAQAPLALTESHLATLAAASQSPEAIKQLLDSGLPSLLVRSLVNFCFNHISSSDCATTHTDFTQERLRRQHTSQHFSRMPVTADLVAPILRFLTEVGNCHVMKDWLGSAEVNPLWTALLFLLCHSGASTAGHVIGPPHASSRCTMLNSSAGNGLTTQQRTAVENATVAFFLQCISGHPNNQRLMAQVLCELFQSSPQRGSLPASANISGFIRRLFLQLMLEDEKVTMFLQSPCPLYKGRINATSHIIQHPMYGAGHKFRTLHLPISTTLAELLDRVSDTPSITAKLISEQKDDKEKKNLEEKEKVKAENGFQDNYSVVVASGLKSQSKRAVSSTPPRPPSRRGRLIADKVGGSSSGVDSSNKTISIPVFHLYHKLLPGQPLPPEMTLAQLLTLLYERKLPQGFRSVDLTVKLGSKVISDPSLSKTDSFKRLHTEKEHGDLLGTCPEDEALSPGDECVDSLLDDSYLETCPIQSPLQVFAGMGGLALIAERLPILYPDVIQQVSAPVVTSTTQEKPKDSDQFEWVTIEQSGELVYEAPETIAAEPPPIKSAVQTMSPIPAHSLAAFGLFLRLPGYAEVLLKERKHAQCLLRLVLGVTDDGEGSHILQSPSANVLPTLPFHVLRTLFSTMPLTTDDGVLLRRMALEIGAIHLILACLSALSHHAPRIPNSSTSQTEPQVSSTHSSGTCEEQQLYWAKGTGFGTGSTASGWDVEQALTKQRLEEEHVTCLLLVLASYINPSGCAINGETQISESRGQNSNALPSVLLELLSQSCLIPAMSSYLRNDSVLDMARHVPLYRALLELLRGIASCVALVPLLLPLTGGEEEEEQSESQASVGTLLAKMKTCVDTYTNRLRSKKDKAKAGVKPDASDPEPEGLTLLVPDIQRTAEIVSAATTSLRQANQEKKLAEFSKKSSVKSKPFSILRSLEEKYVAIMKKLQFDTFEMVSEDDAGKLVFKMNYHFMSQVKNASDANSAARARRLAQEAVTLSTSLPLSSSSSVFVRCDEERLDIMKVLITGPADTPYANGCFEFDVYFPQDYPNSPPLVNLETTGGHSVRFNPNLYNDGKVCLSILNTWHGRPEEKWNPQTSSFLQVLVSIQSLILVSEPYFNEPGYERARGTPGGTQSSREYDGNIRQATVKWAMLEQIRNASPCFKEVIHKHFYLKRAEIMAQCEDWIVDIQQFSSDKRVGRTMSHHAAALKRHTAQLREELLKLLCPEGLDPDGDDSAEKCLAAAASCEETTLHEQAKPSSSKDTSSDFFF
ncbi:baculoviral IAP repeat-containing protein 6 isoform X6 [Xenopus laevis]|uniref:Dual E2 ubiquitin-conjugating enzyme/E3 ubiquitin-protein ligase BIRC6 n=1 Tax=Xenopus laevis TaxID=8355 RepID=A0A8J0VEV8_XENLA|nr:baculoviral IAP repeat-containing protein 6 isoform X6 [Xenopus laevis]